MGKVIFDISMSLDGFITGPNDDVDRLHEWIWNGTTDALMQGGTVATTGAIVSGRRTYDLVNGWGGSHPLHGVPVFVVTHEVPEQAPEGATPFTFVTDGIESAITQARAAAGDKNVYVLGGANTAQECIKARVLDELRIHLVPVLLGDGIRLFDHLGATPIELESTGVIESPDVTHLMLRVAE